MDKMFFDLKMQDGIYVIIEKESGEEVCTVKSIPLAIKVMKALEASVRLTDLKMLGF